MAPASDDVPSWLKRIREPDVSFSELAEMARSGFPGQKGAALMRLAELYGERAETVTLLESLASVPSKGEPLMSGIHVGDVCLLLLRKTQTDAAQQAFARIYQAWDPADIERLEEVLRRGL